jgi:nicotinamidase-related amidase
MPILSRDTSVLLVIDLQERLMPAIDGGAAVLANARRLIEAARLMGVPVVFTEQNPGKLGPTVPGLIAGTEPVVAKMTFDALGAAHFGEEIPPGRTVVAIGCEAHVCVLQTVLGLRASGRRVAVVRDAVGSRRAESKAAALERMDRHGAEIVTAEMPIFEWLESCEHPHFREALALVR